MTKGIIFDMDGTLIDSEPVYAQMVVDFFAEHGKIIPFEVASGQAGSSIETAAKVFKEYWPEIADDEFNEMFQYRRRNFKLDNRKILFPDVHELLKICKDRGIKTAIASSSPLKDIEIMVAECELSGYLDGVLSGDNLQNNKPAPDIYLAAAKELNLRPEECFAVEDSVFGIASAKAAGMTTFAKRHAIIARDLSQADYVIDDLIELVPYINS